MVRPAGAVWHPHPLTTAGTEPTAAPTPAPPALTKAQTFVRRLGSTVVLWTIVLTAIFSTITVIEDRKEGFLQGVLVAPVPRCAIALGKILGGTTLGFSLGVFFLLLGPLAGVTYSPMQGVATAAVLFVVCLSVTGLGFTMAWLMDSTAGYHGLMMVFLMPMLLLSGAFFPMQDAHPLLAWIQWIDPLTYGVGALRHTLHGGAPGIPSVSVCLAGTMLFAVLTFGLGTWVVTRRSARDAV